VQAEAAATLTGLIFVAMSINAEKVMSFPGLPALVGEAVLQFLKSFLWHRSSWLRICQDERARSKFLSLESCHGLPR